MVKNDSFLKVCRKQEAEHVPVWFMRQAGRYLKRYLEIKRGRNVLEVAKDPDSSSEAAVSAARELGVDAAIIFADIILPIESVGFTIQIEENIGPVAQKRIKNTEDVSLFSDFDAEKHVPYVLDGIKLAKQKLDDEIPLIGFSAAPFTLSTYLLNGSPDRDGIKTRSVMFSDEETWTCLMENLSTLIIRYLNAQIKAGVDAIQLFDSWVGCLSPQDYDLYISKYTKKIFSSLPKDFPKIHFCADSSGLIESFSSIGADVLSVDWRTSMVDAYKRSGGIPIQGNMDPVIPLSGLKKAEAAAKYIIDQNKDIPYIFSLGHGIIEGTDPDVLKKIVEIVHTEGKRKR